MTTVANIFQTIKGINPQTNSYGYVDNSGDQQAQFMIDQVRPFLPTDSLAYKILTSTMGTFSEKQIWVIAYELMKNADYVAYLTASLEKSASKAKAKNDASKAKLTANKEAAADVLAAVKSAGKKLGDYYKWLNTNGNPFRSEFFSKKYSENSVNSFLAIA
jgi:hypothetical protein